MRSCRLAYAVLAACALVVSGCGGSVEESTEPAVAVSDSAARHTAANNHGSHDGSGGHGGHTGHAGHGAGELWAVQTKHWNAVVRDESGFMLYRSDADSANPPTSHCTGECTTIWHPVTVTEGQLPQLLGIRQADVGTVRRDDGTLQLTLGGWPLYRHVADQPGVDGLGAHGQDGIWFVVNPQGGKATLRVAAG